MGGGGPLNTVLSSHGQAGATVAPCGAVSTHLARCRHRGHLWTRMVSATKRCLPTSGGGVYEQRKIIKVIVYYEWKVAAVAPSTAHGSSDRAALQRCYS